MKKILFIILLLQLSQNGFTQKWIDTTYQISTVNEIVYGNPIDFKGAPYIAALDLSFPSNDIPPDCGRPLMIIVHGGAWYGGDKSDLMLAFLRTDFAKRGYVTASVNYRLGLFNTDQNINCGLDGWKCLNMTDTSEWYRANYRGIQDVRGAVRYLVNNKDLYQINPNNIFLVGESAGAFVVLGAAFIDDETEVLAELVGEYEDALAPNKIYENDCIKKWGIGSSIAEMNLSRPSLGTADGDLNYPAIDSFRIRGVGSFYGAVFNNIFESHTKNSPALYLFHQPCDLIVPFDYNKLLAGYNDCAKEFPNYCQNIVNRPFAHGSYSIKTLIDSLQANNIPTCNYFFDNSEKTYSCLEQVFNPSISCHAVDNYWLRTTNMATFFADKIAECPITSSPNLASDNELVTLYPNPVKDKLILKTATPKTKLKISIIDVFGKEIYNNIIPNANTHTIDLSRVSQGIYQILIEFDNKISSHKIVKI
ncbi:MAG: T9SS type A sorting domain-containing protein [Sphingobacteriales bacterium]|nr:T9SS type A sorting domain-containing protein [Sphingobacteriales bacterium]MBP9141622.1 T9SS type A sorting domain-containing protein [Chitinophagales bacterium]MDA0198540.1 T9SS type A sorting domain-containing protein [Bacteroidota bacterium]MBK6888703.1 T9SS type A sorting domain-containing protein [Sphingobacteriales bacterium]MBK7528791.1 T9SS type A sorting domain-containing protein [Sphingobacteriales bacterium]